LKAIDLYQESKEILGTCDQATFFRKLTDAIQILANKGNWDIVVQWVDICTTGRGQTITLPREIDTPEAVNVNGSPLYFRNQWYEYHLNGCGSCQPTPWTWDDNGEVATFLDIVTPGYLILLAELKTDRDVLVRVFGFDDNSRPVRSQDPDGTWKDGLILPVKYLNNFPMGIPVPDTTVVQSRNFAFERLVSLLSATNHQMVTGEPAELSLVTPPLPTPFVVGTTYFVRRIDATHVSLHTTQFGAQQNTDAVVMTAAQNGAEIGLRDARGLKVFTEFETAAAHGIQEGEIVVFTAVTMPDPLITGHEYFAHVIDTTHFTAHATVDEAIANTNPIDVTTPGNTVIASARQPLAPETTLTFAVVHNFLQGEAVTVTNSTGSFPSPLLPGVTYYVRYIDANTITLHTTAADAASGANSIVLTSSGAGSTYIVKTMAATASVGTTNNITATGHNLTVNTYPASVATVSRERASDVATIVTAAPHGMVNGDYVKITGMTDATYNDNSVQITMVNPTTFTYSNVGVDELTTADVAGTCEIVPNEGDYVSFTTQGIYPSGITQGTTYHAEPPMSADTFSLYSTDPLPVSILTTGSGQLFMLISRTMGIGFNNAWRTETSNLSTGDAVKAYSSGTLPICVPAIDAVTTYYVRVLSEDSIELYDTYAHAIALGFTVGRIAVTTVGVGDIYLVLERAVTAVPSTDLMALSSSQYLENGATVRFETDGTLPGPLAVATDYLMTITGGLLSVTTMAGTPIVLTTIGSGNHLMVIERTVGVILPNYVEVISNNYDDGSAVIASSDDTIPSPLVNNQTYYLRRIDDDSVEIYDTAAHAIDILSTVGRIVLTDSGVGTHIFSRLVANTKFSRITRIEKTETDGFIKLYAWDTGRSNPLSLIGDYQPDETDPLYRRITIASCNAWVRVRYRRRLFEIKSMQDFIPLKSRVAILTMMKSLKMLNTEFSAQSEAYEEKAMKLLTEEQTAREGPMTVKLQFNDSIWTNPGEQWMD
jgi:hypothetical protein